MFLDIKSFYIIYRIINLRCYTVVTGEPDVVTSEVSEMWK